MRIAASWRSIKRCTAGVSAVEFALILPMFLTLMAGGIEVSWLMLNTMKVQRLASMTADLVARDGASTGRLSEAQVHDIMLAMDLTAQPLDMRERGRMVITSIVGEDANSDGKPDRNQIKWQRFDGGLVDAEPIVGCWSSNALAQNLGRQLRLAEPMFHVQVSYDYDPILSGSLNDWLGVPIQITRTATYRGRGAAFQPILSVDGYPPKQNCQTANGL